MRNSKYGYYIAICAALSGMPVPASATSVSFQGTFTTDDQAQIFQFVAAATDAVIRTWSYAGGTNAAGAMIPSGGFDPYVALFGPGPLLQASTPLLGQNNDGTGVASDPNTFLPFDSLLDTAAVPIVLTVGQTYFVVLTQFDNTSNGSNFGSGFNETGNPAFTSVNGCSNGQFCDLTTLNRTGNWALDITGVTSAQEFGTVPEPGTVLTLGAALAVMLATRRRNSAAARHS